MSGVVRGIWRAAIVAIVMVVVLRVFVAVSDFVIGSDLRGSASFADWSAFAALVVGVLTALASGAPSEKDGES